MRIVSMAVAALLALSPLPALARENYALIVAVADYPANSGWLDLAGATNDAVIVRDYLLSAAPAAFSGKNVETLTSGQGFTQPTRAAIVAALDGLAAKADEGDFVYLHFSGHGSQQVITDDLSEPDKLDEFFAPSDIGRPPFGQGPVENALTDNVIGEKLNAIRAKGAFVWAIFDTCHSGTITRGAPVGDEIVYRGLVRTPLDGDAVEADTPRTVPLDLKLSESAPAEAGKGGLVAFYAAQSTEREPETKQKVMQNGKEVELRYGKFTYAMLTTLAQHPGLTYRDLAQAVLESYAAMGANAPTPLFEGMLDAPVFDTQAVESPRQWPTLALSNTLSISAGQLHGLGVGTPLLLVPHPSSSDAEAIGRLEVSRLEPLRSTLVPVANGDVPPVALAEIPKGAYARLATLAFPFTLRVARPDPAGADGSAVARVNATLDAIVADAQSAAREKPLRIEMVAPGAEADLRLAVLSEADVVQRGAPRADSSGAPSAVPELWLLPPDGTISLLPGEGSASMALPDAGDEQGFAEALSQNLVTIFRANGLAALTAASSYQEGKYELGFMLQPAGSDVVVPLQLANSPVVRSGDQIYVDLVNRSGSPMDINVLFIGQDFGISIICSTHLAPNDRLNAAMANFEDADLGRGRLVTVLNESGKDLTDLGFLAQRGLIQRQRSAADAGLLGLLRDLGAGEAGTTAPTLAARGAYDPPRGAVLTVPLEIVAATGELPAAGIPLADRAALKGVCNVAKT